MPSPLPQGDLPVAGLAYDPGCLVRHHLYIVQDHTILCMQYHLEPTDGMPSQLS